MSKAFHKEIILAFFLFFVAIQLVSCDSDQLAKSKDGLPIAYSVYGGGSNLLVFVHGWSCDRSYWDDQIDYFSKDYKVVTIDLGGHGESGKERENWTISSLGDDVVSVINLFEYENLEVVGHSMGGMVIVDAATKIEPSNVKLYLVDVLKNKYWPISEETFENFAKPLREDFTLGTKRFVEDMFIEDSNKELVDFISNDMASASPEIALPLLKDIWLRDFDSEVRYLNDKGVKMTLINSDDGQTNEEELKAIGFEITYVLGTGHFIMNEAPQKFNIHLKTLME